MADDDKQNSDTGVAKRRRQWWIPDICLFWAIVLPNIVLGLAGLPQYIAGRRNDPVLFFLGGVLWLLALLAALGLLIVLARRMFFIWPKCIQAGKRLSWGRPTIILGLVFYLVLPLTPIVPPPYRTFMRGFEARMESRADIDAIRAWLGTVEPNDCRGSVYPKYSHAYDGDTTMTLPESITKLSPGHVYLRVDHANRPMIGLSWFAGPLASWGLVVGDTSMKTPPSDFSRHGEFRAELCPGAYVWHDIQ